MDNPIMYLNSNRSCFNRFPPFLWASNVDEAKEFSFLVRHFYLTSSCRPSTDSQSQPPGQKTVEVAFAMQVWGITSQQAWASQHLGIGPPFGPAYCTVHTKNPIPVPWLVPYLRWLRGNPTQRHQSGRQVKKWSTKANQMGGKKIPTWIQKTTS